MEVIKSKWALVPFYCNALATKKTSGVYIEFTGVNAGFLAYGIASLEGGNGVVIMLNSGDNVNGLGKEIRRAVAKTYQWYHFLPDEITPVNLDETTLQQYEGRFRKSADEVVVIRKEKNYLVETINGGNEIYCFPVAKDSIVFTDYNIPGYFSREASGNISSLRTAYLAPKEAWIKMSPNEFTPSEFLKAKEYAKAFDAFKQMNMNEYQLTYLAYELMNQQTADLEAVKTLLNLAQEQHPNASIVYSRWGDYFLKRLDTVRAIENYQKALRLDPDDKQTKEILSDLLK